MKTFFNEEKTSYPDGVTVNIKGKTVTVKGPKGVLKRVFNAPVTVKNVGKTKEIVVHRYISNNRQNALICTIRTHIENMILGVTEGFCYQIRSFAKYHPIKTSVKGDCVVVENYMGGRDSIKVKLPKGVEFTVCELKDHYNISGNDKTQVGEFVGKMITKFKPNGVDKRNFYDGFYLISRNAA
ncbi:MAG: 60S ribosomal protein L6 [Marteilia pararefringens]